MKETPSQKNIFIGNLDLDTEIRLVKDNDYVGALNIRNYKSRDGGYKEVQRMRGNEIIPYAQPVGDNQAIGSLENLATRINYSFVWNSEGDMEIRENDIDTNEVRLIARHDFGWQRDKYITNSDIVDNKLLFWTDTKPRRINIQKSRADKKHKANIYFASKTKPFWNPSPVFSVNIIVSDANAPVAIEALPIAIPFETRNDAASVVATFINNNINLSAFCEATVCGDAVEIEFKQEGYYTIEVIISDTNYTAISVPHNYYFAITEPIYDAARYPLNCPPKVQIKQDNDRVGFDNIEKTTWQFATQVIYDDFDESTLSPYSDISYINCTQKGNYVEVDYTDDRLNNPTDLSIISKVRILGREGNFGKWRILTVIDQQDFWKDSGEVGLNIYKFFNDGQYSVIDDATANLAYSAIPIETTGEEYDISQENFNNRIGYVKYVENYDAPCIEAELTPEFTEIDDVRYELSIIVRIRQEQQFYLGNGANNPARYSRGNIGAIYLTDSSDYPVFGGATNRGVLDYESANKGQQFLPEGGFVGYLAGTNYFGISQQRMDIQGGNLVFVRDGIIDGTTSTTRENLRVWYEQYNTIPNLGDMNSLLTIKGIKKGKYVLRLASHWCSFGDKLSKGSFYNLNNGLKWQQTSTHLRSIRPNIDGTYLSEFDGTELIIELDGSGNITVSNYTGTLGTFNRPDGKFFIGDLYVEDLSAPDWTQNSSSLVFKSNFSFYVFDTGGLTGDLEIQRGARTELCRTEIQTTAPFFDTRSRIPNTGRLILNTDHNGFQYYKSRILSFDPLAQPGTFDIINGIFYGTTNGITTNTFITTKEGDENPSIFRGLYEDSEFDRTSLIRNGGDLLSPNFFHRQMVIFTTNSNFTDECRTVVRGKVADTNGNGVAGVPVLITRNGRFEKTQPDGTFSILVYEDGVTGTGNNRLLDQLILNEGDCSLITYAISGTSYASYDPLTIDPIGSTGFNDNNPYSPPFLNNVVLNSAFNLTRKLKSGGRYKFSFYYVDKVNRRCALAGTKEIAIPFNTELRENYYNPLFVGSGQSNGIFEFTLNVTSQAPDWADKLYVVRTQDTYYSDFLRFPLYNAKYVIQWDEENSIPVETSFETFTANELYLGFIKSTLTYKNFNSGSIKGWEFREGDRVRFVAKSDGNIYEELFDVPIKAQRNDTADESIYFVIDNLDAFGKVEEGTLVEVYRPKPLTDDERELYFEIHTCIPINNGNHVGLPLKLNTGDTYIRNRTVPIRGGVSVALIEDNSISDNWSSKQQDIGRVLVADDRFGKLIRENAIRFSNEYIADTQLNGLSRFEPLNVKEFPRQYGAINKMILVNDNAEVQVLLCVCENNSFTIYVNQVVYNDVRGRTTVAVAEDVLGSFRTLKGDYGTKNPESFGWKDGQVFWWDINRGCFVRYDYNGVDDLSELGTDTYSLDINNDTRVVGAFDDFYGEYLASPKQANKYTIGFYSEKRGWSGFYSFKPEVFGTSGEFILSWQEGNAYVHDKNLNAGVFYGVKYNSSITFVSKLNPLAIKIAMCMRVKGSNVWYVPEDGMRTVSERYIQNRNGKPTEKRKLEII
jgi:hypothetical protein